MSTTFNVPGSTSTLADILKNGNDIGTSSITAGGGTHILWDGATNSVPQASLGGPASSLSAYPLAIGTDVPHDTATGVGAISDTAPAASIKNYPLVPGTDVNHDTAAGVGAISDTAPAASITTYPLIPGTDVQHDTAAGVGAISDTAPAASISAYPLVAGTDVTDVGKVVDRKVNTELTTTTATTVLTFTPTATGVYKIKPVLSLTAATTVTLTASWNDPNGGAATYTWENAISLAAGTRLELPLTVVADSTSPVTVTATAGTANQVYVSGSIEEVI